MSLTKLRKKRKEFALQQIEVEKRAVRIFEELADKDPSETQIINCKEILEHIKGGKR